MSAPQDPSSRKARPVQITTDYQNAIEYVAQTHLGMHILDITWKPYLIARLAKPDTAHLKVYDKDEIEDKLRLMDCADEQFWRHIYRADPDYILTTRPLYPTPQLKGPVHGALTGHVIVLFLPATTRFQDLKLLKQGISPTLWKDVIVQIGLSLGKSPRQEIPVGPTQLMETAGLDLI